VSEAAKNAPAGEETIDDFDRRAIVAACAVLSASLESPGSQDPKNVEVALQILEKCREMLHAAPAATPPRRPETAERTTARSTSPRVREA
jgi:hypothetical protein